MEYESKEEEWLTYYLEELQEAGFISTWQYQPKTYLLSEPLTYVWEKKLATKNKNTTSTLLQPHEYTPDFVIKWQPCARTLFFNTIEDRVNLKNAPFFAHGGGNISIIDAKPSFDMQNMTRLFVINQKWMMAKYGLYVQKIMIVKETKKYNGTGKNRVYSHSTWSGVFPKTFTPKRYFLTDKSMKPRKINYDAIQLDEYLKIGRGK